jgi:tetratricopeptide (TPR) repeat protein
MARHTVITILVAAILGLAGCIMVGCDNPRSRDAHLLTTPPPAVSEGAILAPDAGEVDFVENLAAAREAYRQSLEGLHNYYRSVGNATKARWAQTELRTFDQMVRYQYIQPAEWTPKELKAESSIAEADALYSKAMSLYRESGGMIIVASRAKLQEALGYFNQLIQQYPSSDKIDDAAYRAARIYEYLKNYEVAAVYYQRTFQWNEATPYPARFRAAYVLDQRLKMRRDALLLYQQALVKESRFVENTEYAQARVNALSQSSVESMAQPEPELQIQETNPAQP